MSWQDDTIDVWTSDFTESTRFRTLPAAAKEWAPEVLPAFLKRACEERNTGPGDLEESDLKPALLEGAGGTGIPASARIAVPELCAAFLEELEAQGRVAGGAMLAKYVRALKPAFLERFEPKPIRNPGAKLGRNDPCPCGSGRKYKKCCGG